MSSFRNAIQRREHKERSQPSHRKKYGLLEKHKDYIQRAKDYHKKQKTIQTLQEKAAFKNPDEFYYKMINSKTVNGVHRPKTSGKEYTHDEILLMKTQDAKYVLNKAQTEQKKVERLQAVLHSLDNPLVNQHLYFAEDHEDAVGVKKALSGRTDEPDASVELSEDVKKERAAAYRELRQRTDRLQKLRSMADTMCLQKELMGKGRKRKLRDSELEVPSSAPVFKWRTERKK